MLFCNFVSSLAYSPWLVSLLDIKSEISSSKSFFIKILPEV